MARKTCLRCDWQGDTTERACPSCKEPLYVSGLPPEARVDTPSPPSNPAPPASEPAEAPGRNDRWVAAFVLASIVVAVTLGTWLKTHTDRLVPSTRSDVSLGETPPGDISSSPSSTPERGPSETPEGVGSIDPAGIVRRTVTVGSVPMSFRVPTSWESFGGISINKSAFGPQDAEAIIFWTSMSDGSFAEPCGQWWASPEGSLADLAAGAAAAAGTGLVSGPLDVSVGGYPAKRVALTVREDGRCDPGYFYRWPDVHRGAFWSTTDVGDAISVWIVDVDGTPVFIESEIHGYAFEDEAHEHAGAQLEREIRRIVGSIRFNPPST
jgi:hypothetical protein